HAASPFRLSTFTKSAPQLNGPRSECVRVYTILHNARVALERCPHVQRITVDSKNYPRRTAEIPHVDLGLDLRGRLRNIPFRPVQCLNPLFEAIVNSVDSIEDAGRENGRIDVRIVRHREQGMITVDGKPADEYPISGFEVEDNGEGF